jgi:HAD superfamily hydrolase (TIGR01490 family)
MVTMTMLSPADAIAEIAASSRGPRVGAFFDRDGTLVDGFTAAVHVGDRIRRRQAGICELVGMFEAALRYRFGRLEFEHLNMRAAGYLRGESMADLDELGERLFVERVASRMHSHMHEIVEAHKERGHTVVLSSSALSIQALPVARFLGISNVQCNRFEVDEDGRLTGSTFRACRGSCGARMAGDMPFLGPTPPPDADLALSGEARAPEPTTGLGR